MLEVRLVTAPAMSWLRLDADLPAHPKVRRLERALGSGDGLGRLVQLWTWALRYAPDGELERFEIEELEEGAGWRGAPGALYAALVAAGFVDEELEEGIRRLHGWAERQEKAVRARVAAADRQRRHRGRSHPEELEEGAVDAPEPGRSTSPAGCHAVTRDSVTACHAPPLPRTYVRNERTETLSLAGGREPAGDEERADELEAYLELVRELHPRLGLEVEVARELYDARAALPPLADFRAALEAWASSADWRDGYAHSAARWIRGRGWRSRPPAPAAPRAPRGDGLRLGPRPAPPPAPPLDVAARVRALAAALPDALPGRGALLERLDPIASLEPEEAETALAELEAWYADALAGGILSADSGAPPGGLLPPETVASAAASVDEALARVHAGAVAPDVRRDLYRRALLRAAGVAFRLSLFGPLEGEVAA
ncbi:MAG: hypothetical protein BWX64_00300 [Acidobacteria bacterium ADurb.Bin051]|nr:MAG: hypothetical protein BWX64_00300 [Acidobacteria bacterium ADurb.Bin051]